MSGCRKQKWVTYAGTEAECWKALLLARSMKRVLTTRPMTVILSDTVPREMSRKLQDEFSQLYWSKSSENGIPFRSIAKIEALKLERESHKIVFLDTNTIALKNADGLFHQSGIQFVQDGSGEYAAFISISRSTGERERRSMMDAIVERENGKHSGNSDSILSNQMAPCFTLDWKSEHPCPLPGKDLRLLNFTNGHPHLEKDNDGPFEKEVWNLVVSLTPELCPTQMVKELPSLENIPWELHNSIAVVGMSCRYAGANNLDEFWSLLEAGLEGIRKVPEGRWTKENAFIRMDNMSNTQAGFLSCPVDTFDAKFWSTNSADMHYLDPQQRLSLRLVWEALEHSGIDPNTLRNTLTGVFGGWWRNDYKEMLQMLGIVDQDFLRGYMGNALGPLTARISHFFELIGPSFSTESGCSTSVAGVDMACDSLRNESSNLAIAVGANLLLHPFSPAIMEGVLSPDGRCKTFDSSADGFGRAEGIAVLILKRFSDAVADGDRIWGLVRGSAVVQEGTSKSMGTPTVDVEAKAMTLAMERSGVNPDDVEFVETHGTGTTVGDPIEVFAIQRAFGSKRRKEPLVIASVKTNIGHTESVCGIAGIQKTLLSMHKETIPKHLHLKNLNPEIDLVAIPARLPLDPIPWKRRKGGKPRIAGVNSFGITGAQAHVVLQETPEGLPHSHLPFTDSRPLTLLTFSAKTEDSLRAQVSSYKTQIRENADLLISDIEYTMHVGRQHFPLRYNRLIKSKGDLLTLNHEEVKGKLIPNVVPKLCFLFTGQGSQYPGMGKDLYEHSVVFKTNMDWISSILEKDYGLNIKEALWGKESESLLKSSLYSQVGIFTLEFCLLRIWESWGIKPDVVLGHSLGEFAAAVGANLLSPKDAITLVVSRSKLIDKLKKGSMIAVGADFDKTMDLMDRAFKGEKKWLDVAANNSSSQTVLAGEASLVQEFKKFCDNNEVKTHVLDASHAFHSRMMDPMLSEYEKIANKISYSETEGPIFISSVEGQSMSALDAKYWVKHTREKVRFTDACNTLAKEGISLFLEVGPHPVLSTLVDTNLDDNLDIETTPSLRKKSYEWSTILTSLSKLDSLGIPINWRDFHRYSGATKVDLPGYHFEETKYWMQIKDDGSTPFHPLLGSFVPNPSEDRIFKSQVNVHRLPFLKDHALGDKIIFPCVGYLDMCMTGGYAATHCEEGKFLPPKAPLCLRNFGIITPVCLSEMTPTEFQVIVSKTPEGETESTIYTRLFLEDGKFKWVKNARAIFSPQVSAEPNLCLSEIQETCFEPVREDFQYEELEEFGFNFGPSLRVCQKGWRNPNDQEGEFLFKFQTKEKQEDLDRFSIHPWAVDPMLQTQIIAMGFLDHKQIRKRLVVPVQIERVIWWGRSAGEGFVYIKHNASGAEAHLLDNDGNLLYTMIGTEFMETTLSNILSLIDSQKNPYPSLAEITWREKLGPEERRVSTEDRIAMDLQSYVQDADDNNTLEGGEDTFYSEFEKLMELYMLKALKELRLDEWKGISLNWPDIGKEIKILPELNKFFRYLLMELVQEGWINLKGENEFSISKPWPDLSKIRDDIRSLVASMMEKGEGVAELSWVESIWGVLSEVLNGKTSALPLLYPEGGNVKGLAEIYFTESLFARKRFALNKVEGSVLNALAHLGNKSVIRTLEVGAGVGSATTPLIKNMVDSGVSHFEYTYTDLSPSFLVKGEKLFAETGISAKFGILNIENCPLSQGFAPGQYDVIIASWVLHATKDVKETLRNLKLLLRPGGLLLINELVRPYRPINLSFGGLEGFWRFTDFELRQWNCELSLNGWKSVLDDEGFVNFTSIESYRGTNALIMAKLSPEASLFSIQSSPEKEKEHSNTWLIFGEERSRTSFELLRRIEATGNVGVVISRADVLKLNSEKMELHITNILKSAVESTDKKSSGVIYLWGLTEDSDAREVCEPFLYICKYFAKAQSSSYKVLVFTRGNMCTGPSDDYINLPTSSPLISMLNVLSNENPDLWCKAVDLDPNPSRKEELQISEAFTEIFVNDNESMIAFRKGLRCTPRLRPYKAKHTPLVMPRTPRYRLVLPQSHLIADLQFGPCDPEPCPPLHLEVEVKAYALNFLDVFMVTKPDPVFEKYNYLGVDIAGIVTTAGTGCERKVGERVILVRRHGHAMPSHLISPERRTVLIPDDVTYAEAATFPMGLLTIGTCLMKVAKAKPGDVVLIHTASGGVGLIGIQMAQRVGCELVVTAGTERKRNYLRGLGLKHVFNSRSTDYERDIRTALNGKGVDIVLNSLTGVGFKEATLNLCNKEAKFIEMSKMNIWSKEEVKTRRPDVFYEVVDVSGLDDDKIVELVDDIRELLLGERATRPIPLPYVQFDAADVRDALEYMEKVKHIGKIVLTMPELKAGSEPAFRLFHDESSYIITGGLGGIGLEVAKWMVSKGAMSLILLGRSDPKPEAQAKVEALRSSGVRVEVRKCDVAEMSDLRKVVGEMKEVGMQRIKGIMHCAGVLADATTENQTWEKYEHVFSCKVQGGWNLHQLSLELEFPLEHFVVFSSMVVTLGAVAQSNYAAANHYLDSLVHYRYSKGLPGTTINWGQWGQVGLAANMALALHKPFTVLQGLAALEHTLKSHKIQVVAHEADLPALKQVLPSVRGLFADIEEDSSAGGMELDGDEFWREYDSAPGREERYEVVRRFLKQLIRLTLKMDKNEEVEDDVAFQDMGMDSLMMVEMKNGLQASVGKRVKISINAVKDCKTVAQLTDRLVQLISGKEELPAPTSDELLSLARKDALLEEEFQVDEELKSTLTPLESVSTIFVTGSTGTLGPYVLRELFKRPQVKKVYCLLQANPLISVEERFKRILEKKGLLKEIPIEKIECVSGDVKAKNFGLQERLFEKLTSDCDAIFNLAVKVAFEEVYRETEDPKSSRTTNVGGMRNVLEFAKKNKLKHVYHASTFAAETQVDDSGHFWESWPKLEEVLLFPNSAYSISKLICDRLAEQAVERGVPIKVFRLPQIGGDSVKGGNIQLDSFMMTRFLAYLYIRCLPATNIPLCLLPVDIAARMSTQLFFMPEAGPDVYNVLNPHLGDEREIPTLALEFGIKVEEMEEMAFVEKWKGMESKDEMIQLVKFAMSQDSELLHLKHNQLPYYTKWLEGKKDVFWSSKLAKLLPEEYPHSLPSSWEVLRKDLIHARDSGIFQRYKIKPDAC